MLKSVKAKVSNPLKKWFKETFRPRKKEDYKDFFTRGFSLDGANKSYPWLYLRVLVASLALFAAVVMVAEVTGNDIGYPTAVFLGGLFANLTVLIFLFELYPARDFSFAATLAVAAVCGVISCVIAQFGYLALSPEDAWLSTLWTAVLEEFGKALPAIIFIRIFKKRNPLFGFLIGAAVGAGLSVIEDMGYINNMAGAWGFWGNDYGEAVSVSVTRGITSTCSHILWTALIGWAFCKFKKPLINFRFYCVCLVPVALHFCWDMPLDDVLSTVVCVACGVAAVIFSAIVIYKERKCVPPAEIATEVPPAEQAVQTFEDQPVKIGYSGAANIVAAVCVFVLSVFGLGAACSNWGYTCYEELRFQSREEVVSYLQNGREVNADWEREFDDNVSFDENYAYSVEDKKLVSAIQIVEEEEGGIKYFYVYKDNGEEESSLELTNIYLEEDGTKYPLYTVYLSGDVEPLRYYDFVGAGRGSVYYESETQTYIIENYIDEYYDGLAGTIALGASAGVVLLGGTAAFITLKLKGRKSND